MTKPKEYTSQSVDGIIERYQFAQKQRNAARTIIFVMTIFILGVYVGLVWNTLNNFEQHKLQEIAQEVSRQTSELTPKMLDQLGTTLNYLAPTYTEAYQQAFVRDKALYGNTLSKEFTKLEDFFAGHQNDMAEALNAMLASHEILIKNELATILPPKKAAAASQSYSTSFAQFIHELGQDTKIANKRWRASTVNAKAPHATEHFLTNAQFNVGLFLELMGLEMQIKSQS